MHRGPTWLLFAVTLVACSSDSDLSPADHDAGNGDHGEPHIISLDVGASGLDLSADRFELDPVSTTALFACNGTATDFRFASLYDFSRVPWEFTGTVPRDCTFTALTNVVFYRNDAANAHVGGTRTVRATGLYQRDPDGDASYKLAVADHVATLTVDFHGEGADQNVNTTVTADHDTRFSSHSFTFTDGHSCVGGGAATGTLDLAPTSDAFTITMPQDSAVTATSFSTAGSEVSGSQSPAYVAGDTAVAYVFPFSGLSPGVHSVTVRTGWAGDTSFCGGTLTFTLDHRDFSLTDEDGPESFVIGGDASPRDGDAEAGAR